MKGGVACAVQSTTTTSTDLIAETVSTANATCEAMVLEAGTDLMALAGWLAVVGIVHGAARLHRGRR